MKSRPAGHPQAGGRPGPKPVSKGPRRGNEVGRRRAVEIYGWQVRGKSISIKIPIDVIERLETDITSGLKMSPPLDITGILIGRLPKEGGSAITVDDYELNRYTEEIGAPTMRRDQRLADMVASWTKRNGPRGVVGFFRSKRSGPLTVSREDLRGARRLAGKSQNIFLLVGSSGAGNYTGMLFLRQSRATKLEEEFGEFPFSADALRAHLEEPIRPWPQAGERSTPAGPVSVSARVADVSNPIADAEPEPAKPGLWARLFGKRAEEPDTALILSEAALVQTAAQIPPVEMVIAPVQAAQPAAEQMPELVQSGIAVPEPMESIPEPVESVREPRQPIVEEVASPEPVVALARDDVSDDVISVPAEITGTQPKADVRNHIIELFAAAPPSSVESPVPAAEKIRAADEEEAEENTPDEAATWFTGNPPPPSPPRRHSWLSVAATWTIAVGATMLCLDGRSLFSHRRPETAETRPVVVSNPLSLQVDRSAGLLEILWNRTSNLAMNSQGGFLTIRDGKLLKQLQLDPGEIRVGHVYYGPRSTDLGVRLEVAAENGETASESVRVVGAPEEAIRP
jgi:hypothetical protein